MKETKKKKQSEPKWLDPKNDRKTPYTDEEIEMFIDGFIDSHSEHWEKLVEENGPNTSRNILRNRFKTNDPNRKKLTHNNRCTGHHTACAVCCR